MKSFKLASSLTGWAMFLIAATVYIMSAEPTTSLWDCGEFISAAYKLEVVHPPGAPLFLMIGRMFAWVATLVSDNPSNIAYSLNIMSGVATAFLVMFVTLSTIMLGKLALVGRYDAPENKGQAFAILAGGVIAGLATTFATSVWFSAVEGEVYALSSFFTGLVMWASLRWYVSDDARADRWLVFISYMMGLSIGVHLLSLLAFPLLGVLFYYKRRELEQGDTTFSIKSSVLGFGGGFLGLVLVQYFIIPRLPQMAAFFDYVTVNSLSMSLGSGVILFFALLVGGIIAALRYAHSKNNYYLHLGIMMFTMILIGFSSYGMVILRANAATAINMNNPSDPYSMLSYLNREQYGDRPLLYGPHFAAERDQASGGFVKEKDVYRPVEQVDGSYKYEIVDEKGKILYNPNDMMLFPRLGHADRAGEYTNWMKLGNNGKPTFAQNIGFFFNYQIGYMYMRYFAWNFVGRQNAKQGTDGNATRGNWLSGISIVDSRLHTQANLPKYITQDKSRTVYYFLPLLFGLIGLLFHIKQRPREAFALGVMFMMTGLAIIVFSNQPPREPRERDYVLVGSIFTFCIWIGLSVPFIYTKFKEKIGNSMASASLAFAMVLVAPVLMGTQNWKSHSRADHYAARDYAINFLESCDSNAIVFTYGDNDTYPLWYAQEVENIRTDVRVVNFSLLAVDWYIDHLRQKINNSPKVEMSIPKSGYKGNKRNYLPVYPIKKDKRINLKEVVDFIGKTPQRFPDPSWAQNFASYIPARKVYLTVDKEKARANGALPSTIPDSLILDKIPFNLRPGNALMKDDIALMDILATNAARGWERPIYFAVTCRAEKIAGLKDYLNLEGLALRIVPYKTENKQARGMPIFMGRVDTELMFDRMVGTAEKPAKFKWGNFDKKDLFVNESYMPSVHSLQYAFMRLIESLVREGKKEKAVLAIDKVLESFPHMNFPYDGSQMAMSCINFYFNLEQEEKGQKHLKIFVEALLDKQAFYNTLVGSDLKSFEGDRRQTAAMLQQAASLVQGSKDESFKKEIMDKLAPYVAASNAPLIR